MTFKIISRIGSTVLPYERLIFGNDKCIDCNALSKHPVAHERHVAARVVVIAIAGHVYDPALRLKRRALNLAHRETNPVDSVTVVRVSSSAMRTDSSLMRVQLPLTPRVSCNVTTAPFANPCR